MNNICAVILAAGQGTRMKSNLPKVMLEVQLKPMLGWVIDAAKSADISNICIVTGHLRERVDAYVGDTCKTVFQSERKGTGHAVMMARDFLCEHKGGCVLVCCGDAPFLDSSTIAGALAQHTETGDAVTVISANLSDPTGYGRLVRGENGGLLAIVEHKEATAEQLAITEINSGAYWFDVDALLGILDSGKLQASSLTGEYYLTDAIELLIAEGKGAGAYIAESAAVVYGANNPRQLFELNSIAREMILAKHIDGGVSMPCTDGIIIGPDVEIAANTTILPGTILSGKTVIGSGCRIGPNSVVEDCTVGDNVILNATQARKSIILDNTDIGPFSQVRPNCTIGPNVHIGDFVEVKNSVLGTGTKVAHLTYVGDSDVGERVNFGCGCVTVNYDGQHKARCTIGNDAFIGCNTNLVAPVTVGNGAYTAAGSTITEDVPSDALGIARARQQVKDGWAAAKRAKK